MSNLNLADFHSKKPKIKYACAKRAIEISRENPAALYPDFDFFVKLLDGENRIIKWTAIRVIGNLSGADNKERVDEFLPLFFSFLKGKELITAANAIGALSDIARNKPKHKGKILKQLLCVEKAVYYNRGKVSPECRNVALGHVMTVLDGFCDEIKGCKETLGFIKRHTANTRPAVAKKAKDLLEKLSPQS